MSAAVVVRQIQCLEAMWSDAKATRWQSGTSSDSWPGAVADTVSHTLAGLTRQKCLDCKPPESPLPGSV